MILEPFTSSFLIIKKSVLCLFLKQKWFASSNAAKTYVPVRWTSQHGSGGDEDTNPNKMNANFVIQIMCQDDPDDGDDTVSNTEQRVTKMRNGLNTATQDYSQPQQTYDRTLRRNVCKLFSLQKKAGPREYN